jgi:hypothetical protein
MLRLKIASFAVIGALICSAIAVVISFLSLLILAAILERLLGIGEVAWYGILIGTLFGIIGFLHGAYYGAMFALRTRGYSWREYGRTVWAFLINE